MNNKMNNNNIDNIQTSIDMEIPIKNGGVTVIAKSWIKSFQGKT